MSQALWISRFHSLCPCFGSKVFPDGIEDLVLLEPLGCFPVNDPRLFQKRPWHPWIYFSQEESRPWTVIIAKRAVMVRTKRHMERGIERVATIFMVSQSLNWSISQSEGQLLPLAFRNILSIGACRRSCDVQGLSFAAANVSGRTA